MRAGINAVVKLPVEQQPFDHCEVWTIHFVHNGANTVSGLGCHPFGSESGGPALKPNTDLVDLLQPLAIQFSDPHPLLRVEYEESFRHKLVERLPNRDYAAAKLPGQFPLFQMLPGLVFPIQDAAADALSGRLTCRLCD